MAAPIPDDVPVVFRAGETVKFRREFNDYPAGEGWVYTIYFNGASAIFNSQALAAVLARVSGLLTDVPEIMELAARHGLQVILCCGETEAERDAGRAERIVQSQIEKSLPDGAAPDWLTIAYEPRWAIGTGRTPTLDEIASIHAIARAKLRHMIGDAADGIRILYGGSVTGANAAAILATENVDGALVGGASLTAEKFVPIIEAAAAVGG